MRYLGSAFGSHVAPIGASVVTLRTLGVLGVLLGASWDPSDVQLGDFVPSSDPCDANLGISWMTLPSLGSNLASCGYLVCE